jgi:hypothetical protein
MGTELRTETRRDDLGEYIVFSGKHCSADGCGVQLTSRNRFQRSLLCIEHGNALAREKWKNRDRTRPARPSNKSESRSENTAKAPSIPPLAKPFHDAMTAWLNNPSNTENARDLRSQMDLYEMNFLLRKRLPPLPPHTIHAPAGLEGLPIEEITFANPEHRTTHGEFLSDCQTLGVK